MPSPLAYMNLNEDDVPSSQSQLKEDTKDDSNSELHELSTLP
jgi:hypothetical protein